jgi:hypothetical protein
MAKQPFPNYPIGPSPLSLIQDAFLDENVPTELCAPTDAFPAEVLYVGLGRDDADRPYSLQMYIVNDITDAVATDPGDLVLLQMTSVLPFPVVAPAETAQALGLINGLTPIGHFALSTQDARIVLRHVLPSASRKMAPDLVFEVVGFLRFFLFQMLPALQSVAAGEASAGATRESLAKMGLQEASVLPFPGA